MKVKISSIHIFFFLIVLGSALPALAQDGAPAPGPLEVKDINIHPELNLFDDKTLIFDGAESRSNSSSSSSSSSKESTPSNIKISTALKSKSSESKAADKEEQDPLSFNFLYLLIQKFKFSDMVD